MKSTIVTPVKVKKVSIPKGTLMVYESNSDYEYYVLTTQDIIEGDISFSGVVITKGNKQTLEIGLYSTSFVTHSFDKVFLPVTIKYEN